MLQFPVARKSRPKAKKSRRAYAFQGLELRSVLSAILGCEDEGLTTSASASTTPTEIWTAGPTMPSAFQAPAEASLPSTLLDTSLPSLESPLTLHFPTDGHDHPEGESASLSHQHASVGLAVPSLALSSEAESSLSGSGTNDREGSFSLSKLLLSGSASTGDSSTLVFSLAQSDGLTATHSSHSSPVTEVSVSQASQDGLSASFHHLGGVSAISSAATEHGHQAATAGSTMVASSVVALTGAQSTETAEMGLNERPHEEHPSTIKTVVSTKVTPKQCTVSLAGKQLALNIDGDRRCDCEKKSQAAEEKAQKASEAEAKSQSSTIAKIDCIPCQGGSPFLVGIPQEFQTCTQSPAGFTLILPDLEHAEGAECPALRGAETNDMVLSNEVAFLEGMKFVGWPLLLTSLCALPLMRERKKSEDDAEEESSSPAIDWLFGRLNVELLLAR